MTSSDKCRFCRLYALTLVALAALFAALTTLQFMLQSGPNLQRYASQFLFHDGIRSTAPAASGSALVLALTLWAHPLSPQRLLEQQAGTLRRALWVALPGYLVAMLLVSGSGLWMLLRGYDQGIGIIQNGLRAVSWRDFRAGGTFVVLDTLLIVQLARSQLQRLQAGRMSLPEKLIVVVTVSVGLRATLATVLSMLFG